MKNNNIRRRYFVYTTLQTFTQNLFFAFGALLVYSKTHSIFGMLIFNLSGDISSVWMKSQGFVYVIRTMRRRGFVPLMTFALLMNIGTCVGMFVLSGDTTLLYVWLIMLAVIGGIAGAIHNVCSSTLMFEVIGTSGSPGFSVAQIDGLKISSGLLAVIVGVILNHYGVFNFSFLAGAGMLLISLIPLHGIPEPTITKLSFKENIKTIPWSMLWANFNPDHEIVVTAVPLVILLYSTSLKLSIDINSVIAIASICFAYLAGVFKDRNQTWFVWFAFWVGTISWVAYLFVGTSIGFLIPGILINVTMGILTLYRESRMGLFMNRRRTYLGDTLTIEFMRSLGGLAGTLLILFTYAIFHTIPKGFLAIGWLFLIPLVTYGLGRN